MKRMKWVVDGKDHIGAYVVTDEAGRVVAETRAPGDLRTAGDEEAHAHLIAAAPCLLAALEHLVVEAISGNVKDVTIRKAQRIITQAKARGS